MSREWSRVKQKSIGNVSPHAWQLPVLLNLWLTVIATALAIAVHKRTENGISLVPFTVGTLVVLLCPLSLVWLKLAARYWKPSKAVSKQSRPPPLDGGRRGPPKQKSRTAMLVLCSSEKHSSPRCKVVKTVVCVLVIMGVLFLLLLLAGDVERNPGPIIVTVNRVAELAALLDEMAVYWNLFLGQLGVPQGKLDQIQLQSVGQPNMAQYCLTRGLHHWVVSDECPTYEKIIAVFNGNFLTNRPLARKVEEFKQNIAAYNPQSASISRKRRSTPPSPVCPTKHRGTDLHTNTQLASHRPTSGFSSQPSSCFSLSSQGGRDQAPLPSTTDDEIVGYADQMRGYYRTTIPQCFSLTWPPPPSRKVFNLSMISHKQYNYGRGNDELVRLLHLGNVDEVVAKKSKIELKNLFKLDSAKRKVVLIEGAPGAGKSTLAWHICQKWEAGELFQEFNLVVFVQLRDPAIQSAKSLADILPALGPEPHSMEQVISAMQRSHGSGVLFVLDGWDEFPPGLGGNKFLNSLVCSPAQIAMPSSTLLITSRPIASGDLHRYASSRVETIGFEQAELNLYFNEALQYDSKRVQKLHDCLKQRPVIKASCYLPLNTVIVVHLFLSLDNRLPNTLHGVFLQLVIHCIVRHIMRQQDDDSEPPHISTLDDLPPDMQTQLSHICAMAYHGVMKNKVTFSEDDLKSFNLPPDISTLSLIQVVVSFMPYRSRSYNFLHLSVQELLTSYHISKLPSEEQVKIFNELFGQSRFAAVFQYYAAFTKLQTAGIQDITVSIIKRKNTFLLLTLLHCLYEAQDSSLCQFVASELKGELDLSDNSLSPVDCVAVGYFLHQRATICPMTAKLLKCSLDPYKLELLWKELKRSIQAVGFERPNFELRINLSSNYFDGNLTRLIAAELIASAIEDVSSTAISMLDLSDNPIQDGEDGLSYLCQALTTNTSLVELKLSKCKRIMITEENGQALSHMLKINKTLNMFTLSHNSINGRSVHYLSEGISSSSAISKLDLSGNPIQDGEDGLCYLCQALTTNTSLVELNLSDCSLVFTKENGQALCHMLKTNKTLTALNLSYNPSTSDHVVAGIAEGLRSNHGLKCLYVQKLGICDTEMKHLADCLMVNDSLEELDFDANPISPEAAHGFSDMLKRNSTLKKLSVSACELTDAAVKPLASALKMNSSLQQLELCYNDALTDTTLVTLGESLKRNTRLKRLRIGSQRDRTTADGWRQFVQCVKDNNSLNHLKAIDSNLSHLPL